MRRLPRLKPSPLVQRRMSDAEGARPELGVERPEAEKLQAVQSRRKRQPVEQEAAARQRPRR